MMTDYELLLMCYRSGQISAAQWEAHLQDLDFRDWLARRV